MGSRAPCGNFERMDMTALRTSFVARSMSVPIANSTMVMERPSFTVERTAIDVAQSCDAVLNQARNLRLDLRRRSSGPCDTDGHRRNVHVRHVIEPELRKCDEAQRGSATRTVLVVATGLRIAHPEILFIVTAPRFTDAVLTFTISPSFRRPAPWVTMRSPHPAPVELRRCRLRLGRSRLQ